MAKAGEKGEEMKDLLQFLGIFIFLYICLELFKIEWFLCYIGAIIVMRWWKEGSTNQYSKLRKQIKD